MLSPAPLLHEPLVNAVGNSLASLAGNGPIVSAQQGDQGHGFLVCQLVHQQLRRFIGSLSHQTVATFYTPGVVTDFRGVLGTGAGSNMRKFSDFASFLIGRPWHSILQG